MKKHAWMVGLVACALLAGPNAPAVAAEYNPYTGTWVATPAYNPYVGTAAAATTVHNPYTGTTATREAAYKTRRKSSDVRSCGGTSPIAGRM